MFKITVEIDGEISKYLNVKNNDKLINQAFRNIEKKWYSEADKEIQSNIGGVGHLINTRTGQLAKSININAFSTARVGSNFLTSLKTKVPYAKILDTGKPIIRAKRKKALTIPIEDKLKKVGYMTPAGILKKTAGEMRDDPTIDTWVTKKGVIMIKKGSKEYPIFVLRKKVKIPAKKWYTQSMVDVSDELANLLGKAIKDLMENDTESI